MIDHTGRKTYKSWKWSEHWTQEEIRNITGSQLNKTQGCDKYLIMLVAVLPRDDNKLPIIIYHYTTGIKQ